MEINRKYKLLNHSGNASTLQLHVLMLLGELHCICRWGDVSRNFFCPIGDENLGKELYRGLRA